MKSTLTTLQKTKLAKLFAVPLATALAVAPAMAQTAGGGGEGPDYGSLLTSFKTEFGTFITNIGGPAIGVILLTGGFWLVMRMVRRGMKSG